LQLTPEATDFAEYIKQDKFTLRVRTVTKSTFNNNITLKADASFKVRATLVK
jgi:hypothetical protein